MYGFTMNMSSGRIYFCESRLPLACGEFCPQFTQHLAIGWGDDASRIAFDIQGTMYKRVPKVMYSVRADDGYGAPPECTPVLSVQVGPDRRGPLPGTAPCLFKEPR